ncbi:alpha/beta hydrolase [Sphingobacteriaceae bacterium]|nr:alpha/beta hydrolase [Sphingobacteriaceae bacterium]
MDTLPKISASDVKIGYAPVNGIQMYYEIHGSGKPLVLIHGGGSTIETSFSKLIPFFAKTRKVIAVELQAHGHTGDRDAPESFEQDADDVAALLDYLKIRQADVLGFSNGGSTTLQMAMRHPELVTKIIPISAIYKREGMQAFFWGFMEKGTFKDLPQVYKDAYSKINPDPEKLMNMYTKDRNRMLAFKDWNEEDVKTIKAPVLLIVGDKDVVRPEHAFEIAKLLPQARVAIVPGAHGDFIGEAMSTDAESKIPEATFLMIETFLNAGN